MVTDVNFNRLLAIFSELQHASETQNKNQNQNQKQKQFLPR